MQYQFEGVSKTEEAFLKRTFPFKVLYKAGDMKRYRRRYFETRALAEKWLGWAKEAVAQDLPKGVTLDLRAGKPYLARKKVDNRRTNRYFRTLEEAVRWLT